MVKPGEINIFHLTHGLKKRKKFRLELKKIFVLFQILLPSPCESNGGPLRMGMAVVYLAHILYSILYVTGKPLYPTHLPNTDQHTLPALEFMIPTSNLGTIFVSANVTQIVKIVNSVTIIVEVLTLIP